eukprot:Sdes_comp19959_c0_seq1m12497
MSFTTLLKRELSLFHGIFGTESSGNKMDSIPRRHQKQIQSRERIPFQRNHRVLKSDHFETSSSRNLPNPNRLIVGPRSQQLAIRVQTHGPHNILVAFIFEHQRCGERLEVFGLGQDWNQRLWIDIHAHFSGTRAQIQIETSFKPFCDESSVAGNRAKIGEFLGNERKGPILRVLFFPGLQFLRGQEIFFGWIIGLLMARKFHFGGCDVHGVIFVGLIIVVPQEVEIWFFHFGGLNPAISDGLHYFHDSFMLPFGGNKPAFRLGPVGNRMDHLFVREKINRILMRIVVSVGKRSLLDSLDHFELLIVQNNILARLFIFERSPVFGIVHFFQKLIQLVPGCWLLDASPFQIIPNVRIVVVPGHRDSADRIPAVNFVFGVAVGFCDWLNFRQRLLRSAF